MLSSNQMADQFDHQMADQFDHQMADQFDRQFDHQMADQFDSQTLWEIGDPSRIVGLDKPDQPDYAQSQPVQLARLAGCKSCRPGTTLHCLLRACLASSSCSFGSFGSFGSSGVADALMSWVEAKKPLRLLLSPKMLAYSLEQQQQWTKRICEPFDYSAGAEFVAVTSLADYSPFWPALEAALAATVSWPAVRRRTANLEHNYSAQIVQLDDHVWVSVLLQASKSSSTKFLVKLSNDAWFECSNMAIITIGMHDEAF